MSNPPIETRYRVAWLYHGHSGPIKIPYEVVYVTFKEAKDAADELNVSFPIVEHWVEDQDGNRVEAKGVPKSEVPLSESSQTDFEIALAAVKTMGKELGIKVWAEPVKEETGWRDISTCPEGEDVLVYVPYNDELGYLAKITGAFNSGRLGWFGCSSLDDAVQPTHWMPLPTPPKETV